MIKLFKLIALLMSLCLLSGCAETNTSFGDYYQPTLTAPEYTDYARVYFFYPNPNYAPGSMSTSLYIRGNKITDLPNGGYTIVYLQPGTYNIETLPYNLITNERIDAGLKVTGDFKANQSYYIGVIDKSGYVPAIYGIGKNMTVTAQNQIVSTKLIMFSENTALPKISLCRYVSPNIKIM